MLRSTRFLSTTLAVLLTASATLAQGLPPDLQDDLDAWRAQYGSGWHVILNPCTNKARMLFGGAADAPFVPIVEADYYTVARHFMVQAFPMFGVEETSLRNRGTRFLPLGMAGTTDKVTVRFAQRDQAGTIVGGAWVNVLMDTNGTLVSIDALRVQVSISSYPLTATVTSSAAYALAESSFVTEYGTLPANASTPVLEILAGDDQNGPVLVWVVFLDGPDVYGEEVGLEYHIAAEGTASVVAQYSIVHDYIQELGGTVEARVTRANEPCCWLWDDGSNRFTAPMANMTVTANGATMTTGPDGSFVLPPGSSATSVCVEYKGPYVEVIDHREESQLEPVEATLTGPQTVVSMQSNPTPPVRGVAHSNAFHRINQTRDWVRATNPFDDTLDSSSNSQSVPYKIYVNKPDGPLCAGRFMAPGLLEMRIDNLDCYNGSFAPILWHEMGHWLMVRYNSLERASAFNEAVSDVFAMYQMDYARLPTIYVPGSTSAEHGTGSRTGENLAKFRGDCNTVSGGNVIEGLPLMGAMWKVRDLLKASHGEAYGGVIANSLFLGWMNAFDQHEMHNIIVYQWLALADDDHDFSNGTPYIASIEGGFTANKFAALDLQNLPVGCGPCP